MVFWLLVSWHRTFFFSLLENRQMRRGCASDTSDDRDACTAANRQCVQCNGSRCNTQAAVASSSLSCVQCTNSQAECAWGYALSDAQRCTQMVVFPAMESCFTYRHDDNAVTRGCTLDSSLCSEGDQRCQRCMGGSCNTGNVATQSCKVCRSDVSGQESCGSESFTGFESQCGGVVTYSDRGCYTRHEGMCNES